MTEPQDAMDIGESFYRISITGDADKLGGHDHGGSPAIGSVKDLLYKQFGRANVEAHGHYGNNSQHGKWFVRVRVEHLADLRNFVNSKNYLEFGELDSFEFKGRLSVDSKNEHIIDELLSQEIFIASQKEALESRTEKVSELEEKLSEETVLRERNEKEHARAMRTAGAYEKKIIELHYALANPEPVVIVDETGDLETKVTELEKSVKKSEKKHDSLMETVDEYFLTETKYVNAIDDIHSIIYKKFPTLNPLLRSKDDLCSYSTDDLSEILTDYLFEESFTHEQILIQSDKLTRQLEGVMTNSELDSNLGQNITMRDFLESSKDQLWPPKLPDGSPNPKYYNTKFLDHVLITEFGKKPKKAKELRKQIHEHLRKSASLEKKDVDIESEQTDLALYESCVDILDKFDDSIETKSKLNELRNKVFHHLRQFRNP